MMTPFGFFIQGGYSVLLFVAIWKGKCYAFWPKRNWPFIGKCHIGAQFDSEENHD